MNNDRCTHLGKLLFSAKKHDGFTGRNMRILTIFAMVVEIIVVVFALLATLVGIFVDPETFFTMLAVLVAALLALKYTAGKFFLRLNAYEKGIMIKFMPFFGLVRYVAVSYKKIQAIDAHYIYCVDKNVTKCTFNMRCTNGEIMFRYNQIFTYGAGVLEFAKVIMSKNPEIIPMNAIGLPEWNGYLYVHDGMGNLGYMHESIYRRNIDGFGCFRPDVNAAMLMQMQMGNGMNPFNLNANTPMVNPMMNSMNMNNMNGQFMNPGMGGSQMTNMDAMQQMQQNRMRQTTMPDSAANIQQNDGNITDEDMKNALELLKQMIKEEIKGENHEPSHDGQGQWTHKTGTVGRGSGDPGGTRGKK